MAGFYTGVPQIAGGIAAFQGMAGLRGEIASAQLKQQQAQMATIEVQKQKMLMQQLSAVTAGPVPKTTDEIEAQLTKEAAVYAKAGFTKESTDIMEKLSMLRKNEQTVEDMRQKSLMSEFKLYAMLHPEDSKAQDAAMTAKERYETKREANNDKIANAERAAKIRELETRRKYEEKRIQDIGKTGGKAAAKEDVKYADDLIGVDYPMMDDKERDLHARQLAERAQQLRTANPALSKTEASAQAYAEAQKGGAFKGFVHKQPQLNPQQKEQKKLVEDWGGKYDPSMEYKVENGQLYSRPITNE